MKALSLKQPWAELIVTGKKKIELRVWNTKFRGEFLIHASKVPDAEGMKKLGFNTLTTGAIIGKSKLVDVKKYPNKKEHKKDEKLHFASDGWGNYGFILENPVKFDKPISCKGKLGFWEFVLK
jgi:predicted transcriptional regulator